MRKERKYKDVPTSELLDFVGQEISFDQTEEREQKQDYEDELELREPFNDIKRVIDRQTEQLRQLRHAVEKLIDHQHNCDGKPTVDLRKSLEDWRY